MHTFEYSSKALAWAAIALFSVSLLFFCPSTRLLTQGQDSPYGAVFSSLEMSRPLPLPSPRQQAFRLFWLLCSGLFLRLFRGLPDALEALATQDLLVTTCLFLFLLLLLLLLVGS